VANILRANMLTKDWYPIDASLSSSRESTRKTVESIISREKRQDIKQDKENKSFSQKHKKLSPKSPTKIIFQKFSKESFD
jgi:hypothetical protein